MILRRDFRVLSLVMTLGLVVAATANASDPQPEPWRILVLNTGDFYDPASAIQERAMHAALNARSPRQVEFVGETLDAARHDISDYETELLTLFRRKHRNVRFDLIMPIGTAALSFVERHRDEFWPQVPVVFYSVGDDAYLNRTFGPGITGVTIAADLQGTLDLAIRLQPAARRVFVIAGAAEYDTYWVPRMAEAIRRRPGLEPTFLTGQPLAVLLKDLREIPPDSIVIYTTIVRDGAGQTFMGANVVEPIAEASRAPVYGIGETHLGRGVVGGSVPSFERQGSLAAELALRVLGGEKAEAIPVQPPPPPEIMIDWRQLSRWGLSESALPEGARILFRPPSLWREYRWYVAGALLVVAAETALIGALLVQRRRRRRAELEVLRQRGELAHASRLTVVGELTASISHEINQPLGAILSYAEAAELLAATPDGLDQVRQILAEIRHEDLRASEVIRNVRALAHKGAPEQQVVDLNQLAFSVLKTMRHDAARRGIVLESELAPELPAVMGDRIQLEQVILNLILNAMEAMAEVAKPRGRVLLRTIRNGSGAEIAVVDAGPGIPAADKGRIFDSFFTTKKAGMGLGLSIVRSIVEAHGGRIWADNNPDGGATFRIALPAATALGQSA